MNYAISCDTKIAKTFEYDVVIVGAGLTGLYAALNIDENLSCLILAKDNIDCSSSWLAQGGIAAAMNQGDTPQLHLEDTIVAGAGQNNMDAVAILVNEGPLDIETLVKLKVPFDVDEYGEFHFTREGGHGKRRVVHAGGDATGRETIRALALIVSERKNITFSGFTCLFDVITTNLEATNAIDNNDKIETEINTENTDKIEAESNTETTEVTGVVVRCNDSEFHYIKTNNVIIATGGIGQLYSSSTNPIVATGDGIAAAIRAGANVSNIEFVQFHPTGLWNPESNGSEFLISEAVRGEGGLLVNSEGTRFMVGAHELAELAPRDIVARGIFKELKRSGENYAFIDITHKSEDFLKTRFPTIYNECLNHGINIAHDKIPVSPIQHYLMGGIDTDSNGCTGIQGLYACGEAANTGVHGANRLASNSMLECLVFGRRAAEYINQQSKDYLTYKTPNIETSSTLTSTNLTPDDLPYNDSTPNDLSPNVTTPDDSPNTKPFTTDVLPVKPHINLNYKQLRKSIQQQMSENCFVIRNKKGLLEAQNEINEIYEQLDSVYDDSNEYVETLNIATVAKYIVEAALKRPDSIGSHYVEDI